MDNIVKGNTIVCEEHLQSLISLLAQVEPLSGEVAEVGVYKGGTARLLCQRTRSRVWLMDTFQGMPQTSEHDNHHKQGDFADTSAAHVEQVLEGLPNHVILQGQFPQMNADVLVDRRFKFVHIDVDIFVSVWECLRFFYPRMVSGGIIVFDDYTTPTCLGAKKATDDFVQSRPGLKLIVGPRCQAHIVVS